MKKMFSLTFTILAMQIFAQKNIISGDLKGFVSGDKVDFNQIAEGYKLWLDKQ